MSELGTIAQRAKGSYIAQVYGSGTASVAITNVYQHVAPQPIDDATLAVGQQRFAAFPIDAVPDVAPLPHGSRMALTRNPLFVDREDEFRALAMALRRGPTPVVAVVTGLGGVGKTQLAVECVHRYGQFFAGGVFWLSFAEPNSVPDEISTCGSAGYLDLRPNFSDLSIDERVRLVLGAWQSPLPRLLIFDNCEDSALLAIWRPPTGGCRVLVTSRRTDWEPALGVQALQLGVLPRTGSIVLLRKFRPEPFCEDGALDAIAAEVGDLPLALHMAGSFLRAYRHAWFGKPEVYLAQLRQSHILEHPSLTGEGSTFSPTAHEQHVARTFALGYEQLDISDPTDAQAIALLSRAAYFAPGEVIPRSVLLATAQPPGADFQTDLRGEKALSRLLALGLVEEEIDGALRMHRLLNSFVRALGKDPNAQASVEELMIDRFKQVNESGNVTDIGLLQVHMRAITDLAVSRSDERAADLCHSIGNYMRLAGDYASAEHYLRYALAIRKALHGEDDPETALDVNDLGYILHYRGNYEQARLYLERALSLWDKKRDGPNKAATLDNLAQLLEQQGDIDGALELYHQALRIREKELGKTHPSVAITLHNLGALFVTMNDLRSAQEYHERALRIREEFFVWPNRNTAASLNSLAVVYRRKGDLSRARDYYERALKMREEVLGQTHPYTINTLAGLVDVLLDLGDNNAATELTQKFPQCPDQLMGASHYLTVNRIGHYYWSIGLYKDAIRFYEAGLSLIKENKSSSDLSLLLNNLGMAQTALGEYTDAHKNYERALAIQTSSGRKADDPTARIINNFGVLLLLKGEYRDARVNLETALRMRTEMLGEAHPDTATSLNNLGLLHQAEGDFAGAQRLMESALSTVERQYGKNLSKVARSLHDLGMLFHAQGKMSQAQSYLERALSIRSKVLPDHPDTAATLLGLDALAQTQGDLARARTYLVRALAIDEQRLGADHEVTQGIRESLAALSRSHCTG